jgi:N utilization substance protein B
MKVERMGKRRQARECALQLLFQYDFCETDFRGTCDIYWKEHGVPSEVQEFAMNLIEGVCRNRTEIDSLIEKHSTNWRVDRMPIVDRNILRIAAYELLFERDIAASVILNEAIEIAKRFGTEESGSFVNGVLDPIAISLDREENESK